MEYIEGESLADVLLEKKKLSVDEALGISKQVLEALSYAHEQKVVHRDLKPANIIITKDGKAKVLDFGIARVIKETMTKLTGTTATSGTLLYMAPEQLKNKAQDGRTDIWAFGIVLYEMLTGGTPFSDSTMILQSNSDPISGIPDYVNAIIQKCLQKEPSARFQNAQEIIKAIETEIIVSNTKGVSKSIEEPQFSQRLSDKKHTTPALEQFIKPTISPFRFTKEKKEAYNKEELFELCKAYPDSGVGYLYNGDIEKWLREEIYEEELADRAKRIRKFGGDQRAGLVEFLSGKRPFIFRSGKLVNDGKELKEALKANPGEGRHALYDETQGMGGWLSYIGEETLKNKVEKVRSLFDTDRAKGLEAFLDDNGKLIEAEEIKTITYYLDSAHKLLNDKRYEEAIKVCQTVLSLDGTNKEASSIIEEANKGIEGRHKRELQNKIINLIEEVSTYKYTYKNDSIQISNSVFLIYLIFVIIFTFGLGLLLFLLLEDGFPFLLFSIGRKSKLLLNNFKAGIPIKTIQIKETYTIALNKLYGKKPIGTHRVMVMVMGIENLLEKLVALLNDPNCPDIIEKGLS